MRKKGEKGVCYYYLSIAVYTTNWFDKHNSTEQKLKVVRKKLEKTPKLILYLDSWHIHTRINEIFNIVIG